MADMRKAFGWLGSRGGRLAFLAGALVLAAGAVVCCIILKNNILKGEGGGDPCVALKGARSVLADRFNALRPVALSPAAAAKLEKLGFDADKFRKRQIPRDWAFSYEKLAADGDFGPRDGHFHVLSARRCTLTGPLVNPESRKSFMRWTLSMPNDSREGRSKIELGIATSGLYTNSTRILQTVKLKPGERKTVTVAADFAGGLPSFRPLAKTTGDVTFEEVAILEAPDDLAAAGLTLVEGTLEACSEIPDPEKSDYPDCRFVCHFTGNSIVKGAPCPQNLSLVVEAFASHKPLGASRLKPGDKVRCLALPFEKLPEERRATRLVDDFNLLALPRYYAVDIHPVRGFAGYLRLATSRASFTDAKGVKEILVDWFDSFKRAAPPSEVIAPLTKRGVDVNGLRQAQVAQNWDFDYANLPADVRFGPRGGRFGVFTQQTCTLIGPKVRPESRKHVIEWTIGMPKGARGDHSKVELGILRDGLYVSGAEQILQTVGLKPGEHKLVKVEADLGDGFSDFRLLAKVSGDVDLKTVMVKERADDLAAAGLTLVEGTLEACSAIPDPEKSDYPDCRFVCHFKGNSIVKGKPCPQELSLILEGFADRKLLGTKGLKAGDRVMCIALPFGRLPQARQTTQQADDLNLFSLESYYALDVRKISEFCDLPGTPPSSGIAFTDASNKPYVSVFERHVNPPVKEEHKKAQQEAIAHELQKIEAMLAPYTPEKIAELRQKFAQVWEAEKAKDPPNYNRVVMGKTEYVWRNVENSFWALPTNYRLPEYPENPIATYNLEALIALRDFLEANGCQFLISPVPNFQEIAARVINPEFRDIPDFETAHVAKQLLQHGIETFYPSKSLIDNFCRYPLAFYYPHDSHPHDTTQDIMTDSVAKLLTRYHFAEQLDPNLFFVKLVSLSDNPKNPYRFPINCDIGMNPPRTIYPCRQVWYDDKILCTNDKSHILVIGNSFMRTPAWLPQAEVFPTLLSSKLRLNIQGRRLEGWGPMTATIQQLFASPKTMLSGKAIIILAVGIVHLRHTTVFNDIRQMDNYAKTIHGKKLISVFPLKSNSYANDGKINTFYMGAIPAAPNFFEIPKTGTITLVDVDIANIDSHKSVSIVIPTSLDSRQSAKYIVNERNATIPRGYYAYPHLNAFCALPAGTDRLKVELVGKPGTILSIRNIQVYQ